MLSDMGDVVVRGQYAVIDDTLVASIVVDVYGDAAEGGDFG